MPNNNMFEKLRKYINPLKRFVEEKINEINYKEYLNPPFFSFNERPVEYSFVFKQVAKFYPKNVLDVGTGITALPHLLANCGCKVTAIDNIKDYWPQGMFNRHYYVQNDDITKSKLKKKFDMVMSISVLEHIKRSDLAVSEMFKLINDGGYLILSFPYNEKKGIGNVYTLPDSNAKVLPNYTTKAFSRIDLDRWQRDNNASIIEQEYWHFFAGEYWTIGKIQLPPKKVTNKELHHISCVILRKN